MSDAWSSARPLPGLAIDHVGIVVHEVAPVVAQLRAAGFKVSDPAPLEGEAGPLGQDSAHCVFANGYIEISAPNRADNHLVPYLEAHGPGIRILALRTADIEGEQARFAGRGLAGSSPMASSRTVPLADGEQTAHFRWFPVTDVLPGVLTAMVEHRDAELVFAEELTRHPNGARRMADVLFGGEATALASLPWGEPGDLPRALIADDVDEAIAGISVNPLDAAPLIGDGFVIRALA